MTFAVPIISSLLLFLNTEVGPSVRVLCYHSFKDSKNSFNFTVEELRDQLTFLQKSGFKFISINDLQTGRVRGDKNILVTIDDGNVSVYRAYKEVIKPLGIRPLLAIYPNIIGKKSYVLSWEELSALVRDGCDIAAHGYYHNMLNEKSYEKDPKSFQREIVKSKKRLEEKLKMRIDCFVYPFGVSSERAVQMIKENDYKLAFTIRPGKITAPFSKSLYQLPRYMLTQGTWRSQLKMIAGTMPNERVHPLLAEKNVTISSGNKVQGDKIRREPSENHKEERHGKKKKKHQEPNRIVQEEWQEDEYQKILPVQPVRRDTIFVDSSTAYNSSKEQEREANQADPVLSAISYNEEPKRQRFMKEYKELEKATSKTYTTLAIHYEQVVKRIINKVEGLLNKRR